ncbi:MAG: diguanylate cyclase [Clostridiales bacterium]|jgi:predicted Fe-Mo cluster-binding NifX family protein|nr:diguanylate cyclase [Clostridiales bacterium]
MRIAFASLDGERVDSHFGSARYWRVYDGDTLSETRKTDAKCMGHCEGGFGHLLAVLGDCDAVFARRIGEAAAAFMIANGKRVFEAEGAIDEIIARVTEGGLI